ncbi:putative histone-lysine N-methyltransferase ASHH4 [Raphanus sativus]|nr:putative histone-lysine N-methyltransferase ASHH4 [Raphanus sativus]
MAYSFLVLHILFVCYLMSTINTFHFDRMLLSSCSSSCNCKSECTNKPFQRRHIKRMKLVQTEKCGYGIAADEDINPGEFIIEYVGEVIDDKTCEERLLKMKHKVETNFYLCQINWSMVIDSTYKGNKSRYFNHSCNPKFLIQKCINDQDCYCGAACCRKMLGSEASKAKNIPACKVVTWKPPNLSVQRERKTIWIPQDNLGTIVAERKTCRSDYIGVVFMLARPLTRGNVRE